jgi:hypothetical protein
MRGLYVYNASLIAHQVEFKLGNLGVQTAFEIIFCRKYCTVIIWKEELCAVTCLIGNTKKQKRWLCTEGYCDKYPLDHLLEKSVIHHK